MHLLLVAMHLLWKECLRRMFHEPYTPCSCSAAVIVVVDRKHLISASCGDRWSIVKGYDLKLKSAYSISVVCPPFCLVLFASLGAPGGCKAGVPRQELNRRFNTGTD